MLSRVLNVVLVALAIALAALLVVPRLRAEPPAFEELHRAAIATMDPAALEAARAAVTDPAAAELYARGIEHLKAGRREAAEVAFAEAARRERERWVEGAR